VIRDDGSQDKTLGIIRSFKARFPDKVTLLEDRRENHGATANFSQLLAHSTAEYVMFCDQDDIWLPHKMKVTIETMLALEERHGRDMPLLVHADVKVVDSGLGEIAPSLWQYQRSDPVSGTRLQRLLLQNVATGCTIMINKSLRDRALPIPDAAIMHDWWLALVAAAFGHIGHLSEPVLLYRQHEKSDIGAKSWNLTVALRQLTDPHQLSLSLTEGKKVTLRLQRQADAFLRQYEGMLHDEVRRMIDLYSRLSEMNYITRRYYMIKYGFFYADLLRNVGRLLIA